KKPMGVISTNHNELKLYYHSGSDLGKKIHAYAQTTENKRLAIYISQTKVTGTQWIDVARQLGMSVDKLMDMEHSDFSQNYDSTSELEEEDWLKILDKMPIVLTYPIAIIGNLYVQVKSRSDLVKYFEPDSKNIDEKKHI